MKNAITTLRIQNFKSIKDMEIKPRRVNLILGEPNVGKSNILEAISLLGGMVYDKTEKFMAGMIRYEQSSQLYYDNIRANTICVLSNIASSVMHAGNKAQENQLLYLPVDSLNALVHYARYTNYRLDINSIWENAFAEIERTGVPSNTFEGQGLQFGFSKITSNGMNVDEKIGFQKASIRIMESIFVKPYLFNKYSSVGIDLGVNYLYPPDGMNLKNIIQQYPILRQEVADMFKYYGLKLSLRMVSDELEVIKEVNDLIYSYPYSSVADTLQRLIFYLTAIESNNNSILLLEEPEAHSFPTYVSQLGRRIVDSENNQFFIVTHSPYLVTEILEEMVPNDELLPQLAIFIAYYEDYQTKIRQLTDDEVRTVRANGTEIFYNIRQFTPAGQE